MRRRLMLLLTAVLLPIGLAGITNEVRLREERVGEVRADALRTAQLVNADVISLLQGTRNLLVAIAGIPAIRDLDGTACSESLTELRNKFDRYASVVLTGWDGMIVCASGKPMPADLIRDRQYITEAREQGRFIVGRYTETRESHRPVLPLSLPFRAADGTWKGVLVVTLDLKWLSEHLANLPNTAHAIIGVTGGDGIMLARNVDPEHFIGKPLPESGRALIDTKEAGALEATGVDGVARIFGFVPAGANMDGIFVAAGFERRAALGAIDMETSVEALCIVAAITVALFAAWVGLGRFAVLQERMAARTVELANERERRSEVEAVLAQSQKLEAVGQLTAGLAHDFNNLLSVVLGNIELARLRLRGDNDTDRLLERAMGAADRGAGLTRQLLAFARNQKLAIQPADANQLIEGVRELLERSAGPAVRLRFDLAPDLPPILVDRGQLEVALLNLVLNARDAMPLGGGITISTRASDPQQLPADLSVGDYLQIRVQDSGPGMPPEIRQRAFEPFFTTKEVGKGSGLGLAQVFGIARQSGGTVALDSELGQGTAVTIYLPRSAVAPATAAADADRTGGTASLRGLRVLLVDDDGEVRHTLASVLGSLGITVEAFNSGVAALDHLSIDPAFDVLISDFAMPEMTGAVLAERAVALVPRLKVLIVTGFALGGAEDELPWPLLKKPFMLGEIEAILRDLTPSSNVLPLPPLRGRGGTP